MEYYSFASLMCMDLTEFSEQIQSLNERADFYHVDVMDGHYVKNITLSPFFYRAIKEDFHFTD